MKRLIFALGLIISAGPAVAATKYVTVPSESGVVPASNLSPCFIEITDKYGFVRMINVTAVFSIVAATSTEVIINVAPNQTIVLPAQKTLEAAIITAKKIQSQIINCRK